MMNSSLSKLSCCWQRISSVLIITSVALLPYLAIAQSSEFIIPKRLFLDASGKVKPEQDRVVVPIDPGPKADKKLIRLARGIKILDDDLLLQHTSAEMSNERLNALLNGRNIAVMELLAGRDTLLGSAAGSFPVKSENIIVDFVAAVKQGLSPTGGRDLLTTTVTYAGTSKEKVVIEYRLYDVSSASSEEWTTHSPSQTLRAGTYRFRAFAPSRDISCVELVPVLNEPTLRGICARFTP